MPTAADPAVSTADAEQSVHTSPTATPSDVAVTMALEAVQEAAAIHTGIVSDTAPANPESIGDASGVFVPNGTSTGVDSVDGMDTARGSVMGLENTGDVVLGNESIRLAGAISPPEPTIFQATDMVGGPVSSPCVAYATENGIIEHNPPSQQNNNPTLPKFHSAWADIPPQMRRTPREQRPTSAALRDHSRLRESRLSGKHDWNTVPIKNMPFSFYVLSDRDNARSDLIRWRHMASIDKDSCKEMWSQFSQSRHWWYIPPSLQCDRAFARDAFDCYYLDAMDKFLSAEDGVASLKSPLFQDNVLGRWWNGFAHKPHFLFEVFTRITARALVSLDAYESSHYTPEELRQWFGPAPVWMLMLDVPAGLPIPLPPIAYYYHSYLRGEGSEICQQRAHRFLKQEYCGMVVAFWWNEMERGGRQFVVPPSTIDVLRQHCLDISIVEDVPTRVILDLMMGSRVRNPVYWNKLSFSTQLIPASYYVDCQPETGYYLPCMAGQREEVMGMKSRRVRVVLRQQHRVEVRQTSPMALDLMNREIARIPGLGEFAKQEGWFSGDSIKVQNLLSMLFGRLSKDTEELVMLRQRVNDMEYRTARCNSIHLYGEVSRTAPYRQEVGMHNDSRGINYSHPPQRYAPQSQRPHSPQPRQQRPTQRPILPPARSTFNQFAAASSTPRDTQVPTSAPKRNFTQYRGDHVDGEIVRDPYRIPRTRARHNRAGPY